MQLNLNIDLSLCNIFLFFFKQKTAKEMRISDWSSDVYSSDLAGPATRPASARWPDGAPAAPPGCAGRAGRGRGRRAPRHSRGTDRCGAGARSGLRRSPPRPAWRPSGRRDTWRSEEHTSELQSLMRTSYAVFCLKKKNNNSRQTTQQT